MIEGLFTFCVACFAYFIVLPSPSESGKWLDEDERNFLVLRHKYSAGSGVAEKTNFDWKYARAAAKVRFNHRGLPCESDSLVATYILHWSDSVLGCSCRLWAELYDPNDVSDEHTFEMWR